MNNIQRPDKSSIWGICISTQKHRKKRLWNYVIPLFFGIFAILISITSTEISANLIRNLLGVLLALNGAILGLLIAGFAFSNAIPKSLMSFFASSKAEDYPWSNFKQILLNYVYCYTMLFTAILLFLVTYLLSYLSLDAFSCITLNQATYFYKFLFFITWFIQGFVLAELKIFLFWVYDNSLMLGQAVATAEDLDPYDDGNA